MHRIIFLLLLFSNSVFALENKAPWPQKEWSRKSLGKAGFSETEFHEFTNFVFDAHTSFDTDSVVLIKDGFLVYERHANGFSRNQKHALWSLGKTMINALVGVLEKKQYLHRNDPAGKYYGALNRRGLESLTISHLLRMSSGLQHIEEDKENLLQSDTWFSFYSRASYQDMPGFAASKPLLRAPGKRFNYSSGDSALLVAVMRGAIGEANYANFAWDNLFHKLGMSSVAIEQDRSGYQSLHGIGFASPLDIARLGLFYLRKGIINGEKLLPDDWIEYSSPIRKQA